MIPQIELMGPWPISIGIFLVSAALVLGFLIRSGLNRVAEAVEHAKEPHA